MAPDHSTFKALKMDENIEKEDEISLLDVVNRIKEFGYELARKWKLIAVVVGLFSLIGLGIASTKKRSYVAETTFMLQEGGRSGGGMANYLQIAGQLGFGGGGAALSEDKIIEILKSRRVVAIALLKKAKINGKDDFLANHFLDVFKLREKLEKSATTKNFRFVHDDMEKFTFVEDSILSSYCYIILGEHLNVKKAQKADIMTVTLESPSELFSAFCCQYLVEAVSDFYVDNTIQQQKQTVEIVQSGVDSLLHKLSYAENNYARWKDVSSRLIKIQGHVEEVKLRREIEILNVAYQEGVKHLEVAKFNLLMNTPIIQIIDKPFLPLTKKEFSMKRGIAYGFLSGGFLICMYIIIMKILKDALSRSKARFNAVS